jgi:hypothetical protein
MFMTTTVKMAALSDLADIDGRFKGVKCLHHQVDDLDDRGSTLLWNVVHGLTD